MVDRAAGAAAANLVDLTVDRHVRAGRGRAVAMRFIAPDLSVTEYTFSDLLDHSARAAGALRALGIGRGEAVYVLSGRVPGTYTAALGVLRAGGLLCALFSAFGPEPIRQRMELGGAAALVTTAALYRRKVLPVIDEVTSLREVLLLDRSVPDDLAVPGDLAGGGPRLHSLPELMASAQPLLEIEATDPEEPALLHFTSGTTGTPKGAVHVHGAGAAHRDSARFAFGLSAGEVFWCTADPGWVTGISYGLLAPLACGAVNVVDAAEFDAERWYRILETHGVAVWYTAPTAIRMLRRAGDELPGAYRFDSLRLAASVGEPLEAEAVEWGARVLGTPIHDTWWQTETGSIMIAVGADAAPRPGSMGRPLPWVTAGLLSVDAVGELLRGADRMPIEIEAAGSVGMLALRPGWPSMFRAYLGNEERYRASFAGDWYVTGDLARRDADGYYWFVGRADDVIKTAGHLIGPFEVERVLMEHPAVAQAGVYGVPDPVAGAVVHARIVLAPGRDVSDELLSGVLAHARRHLGSAVAPREIGVVAELPVTRSGKVMRRLLRARELGLPEGDLSTLETGASAVSSAVPSASQSSGTRRT